MPPAFKCQKPPYSFVRSAVIERIIEATGLTLESAEKLLEKATRGEFDDANLDFAGKHDLTRTQAMPPGSAF